jgi:hypothetical protein
MKRPQHQEIVLDNDGLFIDGRNRAKACKIGFPRTKDRHHDRACLA